MFLAEVQRLTIQITEIGDFRFWTSFVGRVSWRGFCTLRYRNAILMWYDAETKISSSQTNLFLCFIFASWARWTRWMRSRQELHFIFCSSQNILFTWGTWHEVTAIEPRDVILSTAVNIFDAVAIFFYIFLTFYGLYSHISKSYTTFRQTWIGFYARAATAHCINPQLTNILKITFFMKIL